MTVYVVTMYRYGDIEKHSYVLGVWSERCLAEKYGSVECAWRANKYSYKVTEWVVNGNECDVV